jgi:hypothetical protein
VGFSTPKPPTREVMAIELSNEMFINMKDVPKYDPYKPYYEQPLDTIQFWENEKIKIRDGITIGGYFVHPWLYFILNYFKTPVPTTTTRGRKEDKIGNPPLNDLIFYVIESYKEAQEKNKILALFGTRGSTKSTLEAANAHWTVAAYGNGNFQVIGGNKKDLGDISHLIKTSFNNVEPAFRIPTLKADWETHVEFGYKGKGNSDRRTTYANIFTTNVEGGRGEGSSEKTAGGTPIGYITDEIGKFAFWKTLEAAIPSFKAGGGYRFVPILAGTSGNAVLSKDAKRVLSDPAAHDILPMNWDLLNRIVPEEFITWKDDIGKKFGTFMPGQMSLRLETEKKEQSFADFLGSKNKQLDKIKIRVSDWKEVQEEINNLTDEDIKKEGATKNKMYYPTQLAHVWLTEGTNPFPKEIIERRIQELEEGEGSTGRLVKIIKNGVKNDLILSDRKKAPMDFNGGLADAPTLLYRELPEVPPELYMYAGGLDDYKTDQATTDSLGSHYILLRRNMLANQPCELVACSYTARPQLHGSFHREVQDNIEAFSAITLMESIDVSFIKVLRDQGKDAQWLAPKITMTSKNQFKPSPGEYGMAPTVGNQEYRFNLLVDWTWEKHVIDIDRDGNEVVKYSVEFLDDIDLLQEMLTYRKGKNADRIVAFSHALVLAKHWDTNKFRPRHNPFQERPEEYRQEAYRPKTHKQSAYSFNKQVRNPYGIRANKK